MREVYDKAQSLTSDLEALGLRDLAASAHVLAVRIKRLVEAKHGPIETTTKKRKK